MMSGLAMVTTVWLGSCDADSRQVDVLNAFLLYHISIGVSRVAVFFDGDATQQPQRASLHSEVQSLVVQGHIELFYRWESREEVSERTIHGACSEDGHSVLLRYADCINYEKLRGTIASDAASRQMLHAELAMRLFMARNQTRDSGNKTRWLLHLDVDELFYCEGMAAATTRASTVLEELLEAIEAERPAIDQLTVVNYEAVPTAKYGGNYFMSATKFRRHTARIALSSESQAAMRDWQHKSPFDQFFLFYDNGKSLVRVPEGISSSSSEVAVVVPGSVHHWRAVGSGCWRSVSNFYDPRRADGVDVWREPHSRVRACVLHFPVCGIEWLTEKYERLGSFPDVWGGTLGTAPMKIPPCFHRQARDAFRHGGVKTLEQLYKSQVMATWTSETWQQQVRSGVCEEITFASELLVAKGFTSRAPLESTKPQAPVQAVSGEEPNSSSTMPDATGLTVQKVWMLAAISDQYL